MIVVPAGTPLYTYRVPRPLPMAGDFILLALRNIETCTEYISVVEPERCKTWTDLTFPTDNKPCGYYVLNAWNQSDGVNTDPLLTLSPFVVNLGVQKIGRAHV